MLRAQNVRLTADQLLKLYHCPDVQGRSGRAGSGAEGSDCERKPTGGASRSEPTHWPGGGRLAGQPPAV